MAWLLDVHPVGSGEMELWVREDGTEGGVERRRAGFEPRFFVSWRDLGELEALMEEFGAVSGARRVERRPWLGREPEEVLEVSVEEYGELWRLARLADEHHPGTRLFDVDLTLPFRFMARTGLFPTCDPDGPDDRWELDYREPGFRSVEVEAESAGCTEDLRSEQEVERVEVRGKGKDAGEVFEGPESEVLLSVRERLLELDPDVVYSVSGGDVPYLLERGDGAGLDDYFLGRAEGGEVRGERSYHSYGRTVYKPPTAELRGRIHVDGGGSFVHREAGMEGVVELARLSGKPLGEVAGISPGSVISAMQASLAIREGVMVPWKKDVPEGFRSLRHLVKADRGGFIHQPETGFHEGLVEVDFSSLYPNVIVERNVSPETLNCGCCDVEVPGLGYTVCRERKGFLPRVLEPVIGRREELKRRIEEEAEVERSRRRSNALKWILVTCFGYTGYRNAKFGKIECHEAICAYGRRILTETSRTAERYGFEVVHGMVDSLWMKGREGRLEDFVEEVGEGFGIPLEVEGRLRWMVFLPRKDGSTGALNRFYGVRPDGSVKARGLKCRRSDSPPLVKRFQREALELLSEAGDREGFLERVPEVRGLLEGFLGEVRDGEVESRDLAVRSKVSKGLDDYGRSSFNAAALERYRELGVEKRPGEAVRYVVRREGSEGRERVRLVEEEPERYDAGYYAERLEEAFEEMFRGIAEVGGEGPGFGLTEGPGSEGCESL